MPSPFPGMDPYLEGEQWVSFHAQFAAEIARLLSPQIKPRYVALAERQYVFDTPDSTEVAVRRPKTGNLSRPDVSVIERPGGGSPLPPPAAPPWDDQGGVAIAPLQLAAPVPEPYPTYRVKVEHVVDHELVTAIEVLSPANKRGGRKDYLRKRRRILAGPTHLIEIDLTRRGRRVPMVEPLPPEPYFVLLSRTQKRPIFDVWPLTLRDRLPLVPVPLLSPDPDVKLDLQQALTNVYDIVGYELICDYTKPPEVRLTPDEQAWADERLRAAGARA